MNRSKRFDCIEFKRRSQERIFKDIRHLTAEEEVAYFRKQAISGPFAELWEKIQRTSKPRRSRSTASPGRGRARDR